MKTLKEVLKLSTEYLEGQNISFSRRIAEEIVSSVLHISRVDLYLNYDKKVREGEWQSCLQYLKRKISGEPLEYLMRKVEFFQCQIEVNENSLIPRQETEILLLKACRRIKETLQAPQTAWDICTGTGCLGLGLKKAFPNLQVTLSDISERCIELARKNAMRNNLEVAFRTGDLLAPFAGESADIIICNPPYVSIAEFKNLEKSVKEFEPYLALVGGETGVEFYQRLAESLPRFLNEGGMAFLEIGAGQKDLLMEIFDTKHWKTVSCEKDWSGKDRFFFLEKH
ncbi:MAG: peptide chain release factor N(5)-glutamine methyltransferase [Simkaniaceae bacterium]